MNNLEDVLYEELKLIYGDIPRVRMYYYLRKLLGMRERNVNTNKEEDKLQALIKSGKRIDR